MLMSLGALPGIMFVKAVIKKTQLAKEIFVHEVEQGSESYVHIDLQ